MRKFNQKFEYDVYCESCKSRYSKIRYSDNNPPRVCSYCGDSNIFVTTEIKKWCELHGSFETSAEHWEHCAENAYKTEEEGES